MFLAIRGSIDKPLAFSDILPAAPCLVDVTNTHTHTHTHTNATFNGKYFRNDSNFVTLVYNLSIHNCLLKSI